MGLLQSYSKRILRGMHESFGYDIRLTYAPLFLQSRIDFLYIRTTNNQPQPILLYV
jgi:hypothetical protein